MKKDISQKAAFATLGLGALSLICIALVHVLNPELDPSWRPISELARGNFGWIMTIAFLSWGLMGITLLAALRPHIKTRGGKIGLGLLLIGTLGPLLAGIFVTDPYNVSADAMTTAGTIHAAAVVLCDFIPAAALVLSISLLRKSPGWSAVKLPVILTTAVIWAAFIVLSGAMMVLLPANDNKLGPEVRVGWHNRFMVVSYIIWAMTLAWAAYKVRKNKMNREK